MKAAKWMGISPADLDKLPLYWTERALVAMRAEAEAKEILTERARIAADSRRAVGL